ncbi:histidine kinase [Terrimonas sp. NA20]|uniref:Histidine kinase n=1 Tax=Terrimonas ginsenosidimutans TaxID=2908004 RepID=A0ABS9KKI0_9BACT|nr:histidine kinase [Terrimonas ginsenosidimutans]MCG2612834.1 histidine kinase [Terrimonas ginsenosidimutans]
MQEGYPEFRNSAVVDFIVHDKYRVLRHISLCLGFLALIYYSTWVKDYEGEYKTLRPLIVWVVFAIMFYINMYLLVPKIFFKGKYLLYLLLVFILVKAGLTLLSFIITAYLGPEYLSLDDMRLSKPRKEYEGMLIVIPIILMTTTIKLFQRWAKDNERIAALNQSNLTMELNGLRNQINPHFLFNMLNSIKALVRIDQEKATTVIVKFSEFLRYQLYENNENRASLRNEINFISNFLNLEKLRRDNLRINISCLPAYGEMNDIQLPSNLFTAFIENAVKHSVTIQQSDSFINVIIEVTDSRLTFTCKNSTDPAYVPSSANSGGLGLPNIKRRLNLLYNDMHELDIRTTPGCYSVHLIIPV